MSLKAIRQSIYQDKYPLKPHMYSMSGLFHDVVLMHETKLYTETISHSYRSIVPPACVYVGAIMTCAHYYT